MILVDTSVLIDYFKGRSNKATGQLDSIIANGLSFGICHFIYQELLQGVKTHKEFVTLKEYLQRLPFYDLKQGKQSYEQAALLNFYCRRSGITVRSTIDLLIVQIAIENNLYLLHSDKDFDFIAGVIGSLNIYSNLK